MSPKRPKRTPHTKSRKGCDQCKRRRVKCDELRPTCSGCDRLDLPCAFRNNAAPNSSRDHTSTASPQELPRDSATWSTTDMKLLQHYMSCSCLSFSPGTALHERWTIRVSDIALSTPYLLHQLLAVAALHMTTMEGSDPTLFEVASRHRELALEGVRPVMANWEPDSGISLFAFAGLTSIYSYGEVSLAPKKDVQADVIGRLISSTFHLARGISTVITAHRSEIQGTWASDMISLDAGAEISALRSSGLGLKQLDHLSTLIRTCGKESEVVDAYLHAASRCLENISLLLHNRDAEDDNISHLIMSWPNEIREVYLLQLERREPVALVILAHYAVLMKMRTRYWWLNGLPSLLLGELERSIPSQFQPYLEWPRRMVVGVCSSQPEKLEPNLTPS